MATAGENDNSVESSELDDVSKSSDDANGRHITFWDTKLSSVKTVKDIYLRDDKAIPSISGMCMLDNGEIILCDNANHKLKIINDISTAVKYDTGCNAAPFDVALLNENQVVVTMPEKRELQYVIVKPGIKLDKTVKVQGQCYGINIHESNIYVCILGEGVCILSDTGTKQSTIPYQSSGIPKYICVALDSKEICYSGGSEEDAFVSIMTREGHGLKKCTSDINTPAGLSLDGANNIMLLDSGTNKIYVIHNKDGSRQCLLSKSVEKYKFTSMFFNHRNRRLVVACSEKKDTYNRSTDYGKSNKDKPECKVKIYQLERTSGIFSSFRRTFLKT